MVLHRSAKAWRLSKAKVVLVPVLVALLGLGCDGFSFGGGALLTTTIQVNSSATSRRGSLPPRAALIARTTRGGDRVATRRQSTSSSNNNSNQGLEKPNSSTSTLANYHLLWSPKVLKKMALTTLSLWITLRTVPWEALHYENVPWLRNRLIFNAILPTLSSACCWIQIVLNMVTAVGC